MASPPSTPHNRNPRSKNPRESARRESSRIRTPSTQPGYVPTQQDSRRSLVSPAPASDRRQGSRKASKKRKVTVSSDDDAPDPHNPSQRDTTTQNPFSGTTQVASRTGEIVVIDTAQDSEEENGKKSARSQKKKDADKDKDGYDHVRLYFYTPGSGPKQILLRSALKYRTTRTTRLILMTLNPNTKTWSIKKSLTPIMKKSMMLS
ncbi:hypothetical protein PtA15_1A137 [Puccinia triticina]|uniref:Uncharacterized protein n=1 Tax=Puccinia triticina TaxID=208348 RepID=A0ABY7C7X2_9BASI|nr:uncharacterized protein PtA15_1A137 [Puccinia triticina]WAQ80799.1 hypothetical protein PtA15_1A137 [Puccinia triticina]